MDIYGRLTLDEMVNNVWRRLDLLRYNVNTNPGLPSAGMENGLQQIDRLVSYEDVQMYLNMALAGRCVDVNINDNTIMADESYADIVASQVEYPLPPDLMFLRAVYFKPYGITGSFVPPNQRRMLYELDSDDDIAQQPSADVMLTYRRRLNMIVLNQVPQNNNSMGLIFDYVKMMQPLLVAGQVLETPLAWILQQVIMEDAVIAATIQKLKLDATELRASQMELFSKLQLAVLNYHAPKTIRMVPSVPMAYPPMGRRNGSWSSRFGLPGYWWW